MNYVLFCFENINWI